jgi:hypothetical protein
MINDIIQFYTGYLTTLVQLQVVKGKVVPLHAKDGAWGERRYSSYSFLTSAVEGSDSTLGCSVGHTS